ncbi:uncharacterized protein G2W53_033954 [Senna tora]|uniref:Uncharacterized protein n=1 Tax=Senna tora TaxID=362788 RepID=A0A834SYH4_9FABA|nr:uncharacterized protein G2W53_033954 [Senna tora]
MFIGEYGVFQRQDDEAALISFFFFYSQAYGNGFGKHHQDSHLRLDLLPKLGCRKIGSCIGSGLHCQPNIDFSKETVPVLVMDCQLNNDFSKETLS